MKRPPISPDEVERYSTATLSTAIVIFGTILALVITAYIWTPDVESIGEHIFNFINKIQ